MKLFIATCLVLASTTHAAYVRGGGDDKCLEPVCKGLSAAWATKAEKEAAKKWETNWAADVCDAAGACKFACVKLVAKANVNTKGPAEACKSITAAPAAVAAPATPATSGKVCCQAPGMPAKMFNKCRAQMKPAPDQCDDDEAVYGEVDEPKGTCEKLRKKDKDGQKTRCAKEAGKHCKKTCAAFAGEGKPAVEKAPAAAEKAAPAAEKAAPAAETEGSCSKSSRGKAEKGTATWCKCNIEGKQIGGEDDCQNVGGGRKDVCQWDSGAKMCVSAKPAKPAKPAVEKAAPAKAAGAVDCKFPTLVAWKEANPKRKTDGWCGCMADYDKDEYGEGPTTVTDEAICKLRTDDRDGCAWKAGKCVARGSGAAPKQAPAAPLTTVKAVKQASETAKEPGKTCVTKNPVVGKACTKEADLVKLENACEALAKAGNKPMFVIYPPAAGEKNSNCWLCDSMEKRDSKMTKSFLFKTPQ